MKTKFQLSAIALLAILVLCSLPLFGQETTGSIMGSVTDPSGAYIAGVTVDITDQETGQSVTVFTGSDGEYMALELDPGRYSATFEMEGFARKEVRDIVVLLGRTSQINAKLEVGGLEETITVTSTPIIDTSSTMVALNIPSEEFDRLPKARTFQDLAAFQTSVNTGEVEGGFQVNGASAAENNYYIDGVSTTSVLDGSARQSAVLEYVQEVQVKTAGLEAEYGGALGGVVSAVTRSGGNTFHGEMNYYYYGNRLNAAPTKRLDFDGTTLTADYVQDKKQKNDYNEIGGTLSGPIIKDNLWFFTSVAPVWNKASYTYLFDVEGQEQGQMDSLQRDAHKMNWFSKLSWDPTDRIQTNFTYLYTPTYRTGSLPTYDGAEPNSESSFISEIGGYRTRGYNQPENSWTGSIVFTLTPSALLSVKGGRYYLNYKEIGIPYDKEYWWQTDATELPFSIPGQYQRQDGAKTPASGKTSFDISTRTYVQTDYSQYLNFGGQHNFKFGIGVQKNVNSVLDSWSGRLGRVNLFWDEEYEVTPGVFDRGQYGYYTVDYGGAIGSAGATIIHMYFQDAWRIVPRLTLNIGLRMEREVIPAYDVAGAEEELGTKYAFKFGFGDKVAPRLGASFDLFGDGRVKIYGGWGRFFDWTKYELARGTFGADIWHEYYRSLDTLDIFGIDLNNMPGRNLYGSGEYADWRQSGFDAIDLDLKPMSADILNFGVEYEIAPRVVFSGRYTRNKLNRTIEDFGRIGTTGGYDYYYGNPGEGLNKYAFVSGETCEVVVDGNCTFVMPKAKRIYNAMELSVSRRFAEGWLGTVSYVYSDLSGNYTGLQNTDEIRPPSLGYGYSADQVFGANNFRPGGNANLNFDLDEIMFDAHGNKGVYGPLPTDRPHVFKLYGSKRFSFGTDVGVYFRVMSGTPVSTIMTTAYWIPALPEGRGDLGRTPVLSQTDLLLSHTFDVGEGKKLVFEFNFENLFNQKTATYIFDRYNREEVWQSSGAYLGDQDLTEGYDWQELVLESAMGEDALDPRYKMNAIFNPGFSGRFSVKYSF